MIQNPPVICTRFGYYWIGSAIYCIWIPLFVHEIHWNIIQCDEIGWLWGSWPSTPSCFSFLGWGGGVRFFRIISKKVWVWFQPISKEHVLHTNIFLRHAFHSINLNLDGISIWLGVRDPGGKCQLIHEKWRSKWSQVGERMTYFVTFSLWTWNTCTTRPEAQANFLGQWPHLKCLDFWCCINIFSSRNFRSQYLNNRR